MEIRYISRRFTIQLCKYGVSNPVYRPNPVPLGDCESALLSTFSPAIDRDVADDDSNGGGGVVAPMSRGRPNENLQRQIAVRIFSGYCTSASFVPGQLRVFMHRMF